MEFIKSNKNVLVVAAVVIIVGVIMLPSRPQDTTKTDSDKKTQASKTTEKSESKEAKTTEPKKTATKTESDKEKSSTSAKSDSKTESSSSTDNKMDFVYTAKDGDSYTVLARKSVMSYNKANNKKLNKAQIIAAETFLTQSANSPSINTGSKISITQSSVSNAVQKASLLSPSSIAAWQSYVALVDFNI